MIWRIFTLKYSKEYPYVSENTVHDLMWKKYCANYDLCCNKNTYFFFFLPWDPITEVCSRCWTHNCNLEVFFFVTPFLHRGKHDTFISQWEHIELVLLKRIFVFVFERTDSQKIFENLTYYKIRQMIFVLLLLLQCKSLLGLWSKLYFERFE